MTEPRAPGARMLATLLLAAFVFVVPRASSAAGAAGSSVAGTAADSLVIWAPVSLASAFREVADACGNAAGGLPIEIVIAGSEEIRERLTRGADADLVAMADSSVLGSLARAGKTGPPRPFATGRLALIAGNAEADPDLISYLSLSKPGLKIASAVPSTALGRYTEVLLMRMQNVRRDAPRLVPAIRVNLSQDQPDGRAILSRVARGEAAAGIVFAADVDAASSRVRTLNMPEFIGPRAPCVAATVLNSRHRAAAEAFLACLAGPAGRDALQRRGVEP